MHGLAPPVALGGEAVALLEAPPEQCQRTGHGADLVGRGRWNLDRKIAGPESFDRAYQTAQAWHDRAQDDEGKQYRGQHGDDIDVERQPRCEGDVGDDALAARGHFAVQLIDERREQVVDLDTALTGLRQQLVAKDAMVGGVFVDRLVGGFFVLGTLGAQLGDKPRFAIAERIEEAVHAFTGSGSVALGGGEQADREIGEPVAHFAEGDACAVRGVDGAAQLARFHHRARAGGELVRQVGIRPDHDAEQHARQRKDSRADAEAGHHGPATNPRDALPPAALLVEDDADDGTEIPLLAAFLRKAGDVCLTLGRAMAAETRRRIVFRHHHAKGLAPAGADDG